jgi:hypothetical protein
VVGELPLDANRILKDYLLQAAYHAGTTGDGHRLQRHYLRLEQAGRHSRLSTAKLLLRLARAMVLTESPYLPAEILHRDPQTTPNHLIDYCRAQLTAVQTKWKGYDLSGIAPDANRLTRWKESTHELIAMLSKNVCQGASPRLHLAARTRESVASTMKGTADSGYGATLLTLISQSTYVSSPCAPFGPSRKSQSHRTGSDSLSMPSSCRAAVIHSSSSFLFTAWNSGLDGGW